MITQRTSRGWYAADVEGSDGAGRVLLVEDSPTQAGLIRHLLEDAGFAVETVPDGCRALGRIRERCPDVIVTDLIMAGMGGLDLIEVVRRDFPFIPVVLVTAFGSEQVAARALRAGAASYVPKRDLDDDLVPTLTGLLQIALGRSAHRTAMGLLTRTQAQFALASDPALVPPLVRHLEETLASMQFCDAATLIHVGVALREALVNAIEHGNLEVGHAPAGEYHALVERRRHEAPYCDRRVHLTATLSPSEAAYVVRDEGPGFDLATSEDPVGPGSLASGTGRGLRLIRTFMDEVSQAEGRNALSLVKRSGPPPASESIRRAIAKRGARSWASRTCAGAAV